MMTIRSIPPRTPMRDKYPVDGAPAPINNDDIALLLSLMSSWAREVPEGLDSTMYGTGSYDGDLRIKQRVDEIKRKID